MLLIFRNIVLSWARLDPSKEEIYKKDTREGQPQNYKNSIEKLKQP